MIPQNVFKGWSHKMFSKDDPTKCFQVMIPKMCSRNDPADQWREEGTLLPLWKLALPIENNDGDEDNQVLALKQFNQVWWVFKFCNILYFQKESQEVTCLQWNPAHEDLIAVGIGSFDILQANKPGKYYLISSYWKGHILILGICLLGILQD